MAPTPEPPLINIEPENCPEAVINWFNLTSQPKYKRQCALNRDLSLRTKKHLLYLGWKLWHVFKKDRWELRYTSPISGKNYISLRRACQGCIEEGGCINANSLQIINVVQENNKVDRMPSIPASKETKRPRKPKKKIKARASKRRQKGDSSNNVAKKGKIWRSGIACECCDMVFSPTRFEAHAGCTKHRPNANIFLEDGRSLLDCQKEALCSQQKVCPLMKKKTDNDSICAICCYGGELLLCDRCPSSFHLNCLGLEHVPDGDWFCPACCCKICKRLRCIEDCDDDVDANKFLACHQCEGRYHVGCLRDPADTNMGNKGDHVDIENWLCSGDCESVFLSLQKLLGKGINVGADNNLTWTLLKSAKSYSRGKSDLILDEIGVLSQNETKLSVALRVLHECFNPIVDNFSGRDMMADGVFSRGSELSRLNFRGFYTVVLERDEEVVSVATIRILGKRVAEIPFVATRVMCRKQGMCGILMKEIEKKLRYLGVEEIVLPSSQNAKNIWTNSFGFVRMTSAVKSQFLDMFF